VGYFVSEDRLQVGVEERGKAVRVLFHEVMDSKSVVGILQGYLAHKKTPIPLGLPQNPRHRPTVGSWGEVVFYERGAPVVAARCGAFSA
jgi:hypothetical protein